MVDPQTINVAVDTQPLYITIIALLIPVLVGIAGWYFGHKSAMKQIEKTFIKQLQIEASRELIKCLREFLSSIADLEVFLVKTKDDFISHANNPTDKEKVSRLKNAYNKHVNLQHNFASNLIECIHKYEDNEVILKEFKKFHFTIFNVHQRLIEIGKPYVQFLSKISYRQVSYGNPIDMMTVNQFKEYTKKFLDFVMDITAYSDDYIRELQNCYQSDLFRYKIPQRKPLDKSKVLTLENSK